MFTPTPNVIFKNVNRVDESLVKNRSGITPTENSDKHLDDYINILNQHNVTHRISTST